MVFGVSTARPSTWASVAPWRPFYCDYEPSPLALVRRALRRVPVAPDDVFLDLGSGKGLVVLCAARLPFRRVVGVEPRADLHRIAQENLKRFRGSIACGAVELIHADAADLPLPDDVTHVYLFNPFLGPVAETVFREIAASQRRAPRAIHLVYLFPEPRERELLRELMDVRRMANSDSGLEIYELGPPAIAVR